MDVVTAALNEEYAKVKENLRGVDERFIQLYGREPIEKRQLRKVSHGDSYIGNGSSPAGRLFGEARKIIKNPNRDPVGFNKMSYGSRYARKISQEDHSSDFRAGIHSRLGPKRRREAISDDDENDDTQPTLQSAVVMQPAEPLKRENSVAMKTDKKGMARNRRMFGALLGTLQSFRNDSKKEEDREKRRAQVERKLEEKQRDEQMKLRHARAALWDERREKQRELRQLEAKMRLVKSFEEWEKVIQDQAHHIKTTKGKHYILYRPKVMLPANEKARQVTANYIEDEINERRERLQQEIDRVMSAPVRKRDNTAPQKTNDSKQPCTGDENSESSEDDASDSDDSEDMEKKDPVGIGIKMEKEELIEVKDEIHDVAESNVNDQQEDETGTLENMSDDQ